MVQDKEEAWERPLGITSEAAAGPLAYSLLTVALDRIHEAAYLIDEGSRFRFVNKEACSTLGYAREELLTLGLADVDPGFPMARWGEHWARIKSQGSFTIESVHRRKDGSVLPVEINANHFVFEGQDYHLALVRDISARKQAEDALRAGEARLRRAESVARIGHWELDLTRLRLTASEGARQIYGLEGAEWLLPEVQSITLPEFRPSLTEALAELVAGRRPYRVEFQIRRPADGAVRDIQSIAEFDQHKNTVFGIIHDLTEQKAIQAELLKTSRLNEQILLGAGEGVVVLGLDFRYQVWNPFMERLSGLPAKAVLGRQPLEVFPFIQGTGLMQRLERVLAGGMQEVSDFCFQDPATGEAGWATDTMAMLRDQAGQPIGIIVMVRDVTDRVRADLKQARLLAQLQQAQKLENLGQLAAGIAHDMNNVLGAILALATAHVDQLPEDSKTRRALTTISKAAVRGGKVVNGLLRFARQAPAEARRVDLNEVVQEVVNLLEHTVLAKVRLQLRLAEGLPPIQGDLAALTHALMNLCVNAVDAMPGAGVLTLESSLLESGWVALRVQDTGSGMTREVLDRALDPFFTTKAIGKGTGLGLPMVHATVKNHQGVMILESEPGAGTTVRLHFPPSGAQGADVPGPLPLAAPNSQLRVLLVDDDEMVLSSMAELIHLLGHQGVAVASGEEALAELQAGFRPDLVILDLNMPGLGGLATLAALRAVHPALPVLLATGHADPMAQERVAADPHLFLLPKPFTLKDLRAYLV